MKPITLLLSLILIVAVACSPDGQATVEDTSDNVEVMDDTTNDAQSADDMMEDETEMDDSEMSDDDMMEDDSEMDDSEMSDDMMDEESDAEHDAMSDDDMMEDDSEMDDSEMSDDMMDDSSADVMYNGPDWTQLELVNAATNETFTLADFAGKTVFVEPMATWCTNCRAQQRTIKGVIDQLSPDSYVVMSLSVETQLSPEELATYATNNEFGWTFAVASEELIAALVGEFGRSVTSPPSVPHFTIAPDGTAGNFKTGSASADQFLNLVRSVAGES